MYMCRPVVYNGLLPATGERASATGMSAEHMNAFMASTQGITPNPAMCDCMCLILQAAASRNLADRLAKRLDNDA
jgi:hypothetical protein